MTFNEHRLGTLRCRRVEASTSSSWVKRGYHGTFHHLSAEHLHRYVNEFATRHNMRDQNTVDMMHATFAGWVGKRLTYRELME